MEVRCKYCDRYLFDQLGTVVIENLVCPNSSCKAHLNFKIINDPMNDMKHKFIKPEVPPKKEKS